MTLPNLHPQVPRPWCPIVYLNGGPKRWDEVTVEDCEEEAQKYEHSADLWRKTAAEWRLRADELRGEAA